MIEGALVNAITEGCKVVKQKLGKALHMLNQSTEWTGRGEEILDFSQRVTESITLRYIGELDLRNTKDIHATSVMQQPKWKICLVASLARARIQPKAAAVSGKVTEALPKLFGEYCHQSLFYCCPLPQLGLSSSEFSAIASSAATTARLDGVTNDPDLRITATRNLAESSVSNSHHNNKAIGELTEKVKNLEVQFQSQSQGITERHNNQILRHTDSLEEHKKELKSVHQKVASHQSRLESRALEIKKFYETIDDYKAEMQRAAKAQAEAIECSVTAMLNDGKAVINETKQAFLAPYIETIEELQRTALSLEDQAKIQDEKSERLCLSLDKLSNHLVEQGTELRQSVGEALQFFEARVVDDTTRLEQDNVAIRENLVLMQENIKKMMRELGDSIIVKTRGELSIYLKEQLSSCVNNYVVYHLDRMTQQKQQSSSRKKFLAWATSSHTPTSHSLNSTDAKDPALIIQSIHRNQSSSHRANNDDLTSLADTSSVMEESCSAENPLDSSTSWFENVQLLEFPDPKGLSTRNSSTSFVADSQDHRQQRRMTDTVGGQYDVAQTPTGGVSRWLSQSAYSGRNKNAVDRTPERSCVEGDENDPKKDARYEQQQQGNNSGSGSGEWGRFGFGGGGRQSS